MKLIAVLAAVFLTGCSTYLPYEGLKTLKEGDNWNEAFNRVAIDIAGEKKPNKPDAIAFAAENPRVVDAGEHFYGVESLEFAAKNKTESSAYFNYRLAPFCTISSADQCKVATENFNTYRHLLDRKVELYVTGVLFDKLPSEQQAAIELRFDVRKYKLSDIGEVTSHQVRNDSVAGSNFGAEAGLAAGAVAYTNSAFPSSGKSTYTVGGDIGTMIAGALIGGILFNKPPEVRFTHRYAIKSMDGKVHQTDVADQNSLGSSIGSCMNISERKQIATWYCTLDMDEFKKSLP